MPMIDGILYTPFGKFIQTSNGKWVKIDAGDIPEEPTPIEPYPTKNPLEAYAVDTMSAEARRVRRVAVFFAWVALAHQEWRYLDKLTEQEQQALANDFYKMVQLAVPWFLNDFSEEHVQLIASIFPNRQVWWRDKCYS